MNAMIVENRSGWYVIQTNPNCETKAVEEIRRAGFRAYQPRMARRFIHRRTKRPDIQRRPAFVGWIFMRFPEGEPNFYALRQCQGVRGVLRCDGAYYRMPHQIVAAVMRAQRAMEFDTKDARTIRRARRSGDRNERSALARDEFRAGMKVMDIASGIMAEVLRVTARGSIEAITSFMGSETPVEFANTDSLKIIDETSKAA